MVTLTKEERDKFAAFLLEDMKSNDALAQQADKIALPQVAKQKRTLAMAQAIVAKELQGWETFTV